MKGIYKVILSMLLVSSMATSSFSGLVVKAEEKIHFYVSTSGNDNNNGTSIDSPVKTINKALELAREYQNQSRVIHISSGKYFIEETITLTSEDSNIEFTGEGNAILTGSMPIEASHWNDYDGNKNIKWIQLEKGLEIDQLFVNGTQKVMARYPNYQEGATLNGCTTKAAIKERAASWSDPSDGYIRALHNQLWGGTSFKITGLNPDNALGVNYQWVGDNNRGSGISNENVMVENIFEELDSVNEWYYNKNTGVLYYYPEDGLDLSTAEIEAAVTKEIFHLEGNVGAGSVDIGDNAGEIHLDDTGAYEGYQLVSNVKINNLIIENTKRTLFDGTYIPLTRSDWCVVRSGAIFLTYTHDVEISNCTIRNIGGNAIFVSSHNKNVSIDSNVIENIGSSGVLFVGHPDAAREISFYNTVPTPEADPYWVHKPSIEDMNKGPQKHLFPRECTVYNNHIKNIGIWEKQSSQVAMSVSYGIKVLNNTIHEGPRAGINVNDGTFGGHEIAYNDVFDVQRETKDHGMFNSWGRSRFWSIPAGYEHNGKDGALKYPYYNWDAVEPIKIHDNRWHFESRNDITTMGVDLDDGSSNFEIYNNLCLNLGIKLREGFERKVYNNILINGVMNLHCTYEDSHDEIRRNIIVKGTPYNLLSTNESRFKISEDIIDHNVYYDLGMKITMPTYWEALGYDANSVNYNPEFKDPSANDYTVMNQKVLDDIGFVNFDMDQFGSSLTQEQSPYFEKTEADGTEDILEREEWQGGIISLVDEAIKSSLEYESNNGVFVESAPEGTSIYNLGLRTGDIIKSLNGTILTDKNEFLEIYDSLGKNVLIHFQVWRNDSAFHEVNAFVKDTANINLITVDNTSNEITYNNGYAEDKTEIKWEHKKGGTSIKGALNDTLSYANSESYTVATQPSLTFSFTGTEFQIMSRPDKNLGKVGVSVKNSKGEEVLTDTFNCYSSNRYFQTISYSSEELDLDTYTVTLTRIDGQYMFFDAFLYNTGASEVISSFGITDIQLKDEEDQVVLEIANQYGKAINANIHVAVYNDAGAEGAYYKKTEVTIEDSAKLEKVISLPKEDYSQKTVLVAVEDRDSKIAYAYPCVIQGAKCEEPPMITIPNATGNGIIYSYDTSTQAVQLAAKGFTVSDPVSVQITNDAEELLYYYQKMPDEAGNVKFRFIPTSDTSLNITIYNADKTLTLEKTVDCSKSDLYYADLETIKESIQDIISDDTGTYLFESVMDSKEKYYKIVFDFENNEITQRSINSTYDKLSALLKDVVLSRKTSTTIIGSVKEFNLFRADGTPDGGTTDTSGSPDVWQDNGKQVHTQSSQAYTEITGCFTAVDLYTANKGNSADYNVKIYSYGGTTPIYDEDIIISNEYTDKKAYVTFSTDNIENISDILDGSPVTVRFTHNDSNGNYLEVKQIKYTVAERTLPTLVDTTLATKPTQMTYKLGEQLDLSGGTVKENYSDGSSYTYPLISDMYLSGFDSTTSGEKTISLDINDTVLTYTVLVEGSLNGDMNGDMKVSAIDALYLLKNKDEISVQEGDINGDGSVDVKDVLAILDTASGKKK